MAKSVRLILKRFQKALHSHLSSYVKEAADEDSTSPIRVLKKKKKVIIRASSTGVCRRLLWYRVHRDTPEDPEGWEQRMWNGIVLHHALEEMLSHMKKGALLALDDSQYRKVIVKKKGWSFILTGTPDAVFSFSGYDFVVDFKGLSKWNMERFGASDLTDHYIEQVNSYCVLTGAHGGIVAARGKETGEMKYVAFLKDEKRLKTWCEGVLDILVFKNRKKPPKRDFAIDSGNCMFCPFKDECWLLRGKDLREKKDKLPNKVEEKAAALIAQYRMLVAEKDGRDKSLAEIKRKLTNMHESLKLKTLSTSMGKSIVVVKSFTRTDIPPDLLQKLIRQGKVAVHRGESSYIMVRGIPGGKRKA